MFITEFIKKVDLFCSTCVLTFKSIAMVMLRWIVNLTTHFFPGQA